VKRRPRILDLFCGAGGCTKGYQQAGFYVVGVDNRPQPHYCGDEFMQMDAFDVITNRPFLAGAFDAVHASPPCQAYTTMGNRHRVEHPDLLPAVLAALEPLQIPWVVENVEGARRYMRNPIRLHGGMFGLGVDRPRLFQSNMMLLGYITPPSPETIGVYGRQHDGRRLWTRTDGSILRAAGSLQEASAAMGITWMTWDELREAIPPAYTSFVGEQLLDHLAAEVTG
jgi:DNA (cytosine-5)-methyltransferase 1